MDRTLDRLAPLTGPLFTVVTLVALIGLGGSTPDSDAGTAKVVSFYTEHRGAQTAAALVLAFGALALIFFAGSLRSAFRGPEPGADRRASIVFGGALVAATGVLGMASSHFALADNTHKLSPAAAQALNAVDGGTWVVAIAGLTALLLCAGVATVSTRRVLPVWMGWLAIVLGVLSVTPIGWLSATAGILWVGVAGLMLWRAAPAAALPAATNGAGMPTFGTTEITPAQHA
jgi:hypothetical protein